MKVFLFSILFFFFFILDTKSEKNNFGNHNEEYGSYTNPNPRPYKKCEVNDLIKLSSCSNEILSKLDHCKANDIACECCALQSIEQDCYGLCPGNPSSNFLSVLTNDCVGLNDVNACALPFKKDDDLSTVHLKKLIYKSKTKHEDLQKKNTETSVNIKSKVNNKNGINNSEKNDLKTNKEVDLLFNYDDYSNNDQVQNINKTVQNDTRIFHETPNKKNLLWNHNNKISDETTSNSDRKYFLFFTKFKL